MIPDERIGWQRHFAEALDWSDGEPADRAAALEAVEARAFVLSADQLARLRALISTWSLARADDQTLELIIRILLTCRQGRHDRLEFGEPERRLLRQAERRRGIEEAYLNPFRMLVEADMAERGR